MVGLCGDPGESLYRIHSQDSEMCDIYKEMEPRNRNSLFGLGRSSEG